MKVAHAFAEDSVNEKRHLRWAEMNKGVPQANS